MNKFLVVFLILQISLMFGATFEVISDLEPRPMHMGLAYSSLTDNQKYDNNGKLGALVIVNCGLEDVFFDNMASKISITPKSGTYWVVMKQRALEFIIKKKGFGNFRYRFPVPLESGCVYEMDIDEKNRQPDEVTFIITSNQNGAEVFVNGELVGETIDNVFAGDIPIGESQIELRKEGFKAKMVMHNVTPEDNRIKMDIEQILQASVTITSEPQGAIVYIDSSRFGTTPVTNNFNEGNYPIRIVKDGFDIINTEITILRPETTQNHVLLVKNGALSVISNSQGTLLEKGSVISKVHLSTNDKNKYNNLVFVQGGTFQMGAVNGDIDEKPIHTVTLSSFYLGKYEVTQAEWVEVMGRVRTVEYYENNPVVWITWYDAIEFCNKKSTKDGLQRVYSGSEDNIVCDFSKNGYRLPTEAEWEYASRGGNKSQGFTHCGSNNLDEVAWYISNTAEKTYPVGEKLPNELGIYDMLGNVWERCWDWSGAYGSQAVTNPQGPKSGTQRINRGASWRNNSDFCRITNRYATYPKNSNNYIGMRLARRAE